MGQTCGRSADLAAQSEEPPSRETAGGSEGEDNETTTAAAKEDSRIAKKEADRQKAVAMQLEDRRNAAALEKSRQEQQLQDLQEQQLQDLVSEPLGVIDMPQLVPGEIEVFVKKLLTGEIFMIVTRPTDLIEDIHDEIYDLEGTPQDQQWLTHDSKKLEDGKSVEHYMISQGDVIHMDLTRGGGGLAYLGVRLWGGEETPTESRDSHRESAVDVRPMNENDARILYWKLHKDRRIMFVNRTDKFFYIFVFAGQEHHRDLASFKAGAPTPLGPVEAGATVQTSRKAHGGAFKPSTIPLRGVSSSSSSAAAPSSDPAPAPAAAAAVLPPFEVFDIWKNTGRRVHYMVVTLQGDDVLVWRRGDAKGGKQVHFQQPMFSPEVQPVFKKKYITADGGANALSVVVNHFL